MTRALKRRLALGVAVVALVSGGAIAAVSATGQGAPHKAPGAHRMARRGGIRMLAKAASYLGISQSQLEGELRGGKTLAQIANATSGRSEAGLIEAILAARTQRLSAAVSAGRLTQARENADIARLSTRVKALVNRVHAKSTG